MRRPIFGIISFVIWAIVLFDLCPAQNDYDTSLGRYKSLYDSTYIWPDGSGGYNYVRKFVSEAILSEKGRDILSRPATPVVDKDDEIEINAYTILPSGEILDAESSETNAGELGDDSRRIFVNFRQPQTGSILHFEWKLRSKQGNTSGRRFFGRTIPVDTSTIIITAPETWVFNFAVSPDCQPRQVRTIFRSAGSPPLVNYQWNISKLPGVKLEEYSPPVNRIIPALYFSLSLDIGWMDPGEQKVSWKRIAEIYKEQLTFYLKKSGSINNVADSIALLSSDPRELAESAFDWQRLNFRAVVSDITLSKDLDMAMQKGRGSQADGAAILFAVLRRLNIPCALYLIATKNIGRPLEELPALFWFDRLLIRCDFENDAIWIDPFYPISEIGILPFEDQNVTALRFDNPTGEFESTPDIDYHSNGKAIHLELNFDSTGALYGEATEIYTGAMIPEISSFMFELEQDQWKVPWQKKLAMSFPDVNLIKFVAMPPDTTGEAFRIGYTFTTGPIIRPFASRAYIPMDLLGRWEDLPDLPDGPREFPIELDRPRFEFERIVLNIAAPFSIEFTPKNYSLDSFIGEVYSVTRKSDNSITITRGFGLKRAELPETSYKSLRRFFNSARAEADKQIILNKRN